MKRKVILLTAVSVFVFGCSSSQSVAETNDAPHSLADPLDSPDMGDLPSDDMGGLPHPQELDNPQNPVVEAPREDPFLGEEDVNPEEGVTESAPGIPETAEPGVPPGGTVTEPGENYTATLQDLDTFAKIYHVNQKAIELGEFAEGRAESRWAISLARRIRQDHAFASRRLVEVMEDSNVGLPATATLEEADLRKVLSGGRPNGEWELTMRRLKSLAGRAFEEAFLAEVKALHAEALQNFDLVKNIKPQDSEIFAYVAKFTPIMEQHGKVADNLTVSHLLSPKI